MPEVVELYVVMHCEACAASVKRAIRKIPGVTSYTIDFYSQKVTVIGDVDREHVWRRIRKTGKRATLIPKPPPPKEAPKEEPKEAKKEEAPKAEETKVKVEEKKQEKSDETKVIDTKEVHETKEEVVTVVESTEEVVTVVEPKEETRQPEWAKEPEWVRMFVCAPYYTLPSRFY